MADDERQEQDDAADVPTEMPAEGDALAEESFDDEAPPPGGTVEQLLEEAEANRRRANAAMSLVHKEHFAFLLANCLLFAGSLAAWRALPYGENIAGGNLTTGLGTIRGSLIFALAIYGFWSLGIGLYTKRTVVWPFLLNMLLGLWVGLGGVIRGIGSTEWHYAYKVLNDPEKTTSYTKLDETLAGLSTIAPGYWMLTCGSMLVLFIIVKGIVGGAAKGKKPAAEGGPERSRRR
jgi:hypothetical protein